MVVVVELAFAVEKVVVVDPLERFVVEMLERMIITSLSQ